MKELEVKDLEIQDLKNQLSINNDRMTHWTEIAKTRARLLTEKEIEITKLKELVKQGTSLIEEQSLFIERLMKDFWDCAKDFKMFAILNGILFWLLLIVNLISWLF